MYRLLASLFTILLFVSCSAFGQGPANSQSDPASVAKFDELRQKGFDSLYNLDYEAARRSFKELVRVYPNHPAGSQFLAATLWTETLNSSRRLQASLYGSDSFYSKTDDKVDPKIISDFKELTLRARSLELAMLKTDPKNVEALYFLGATDGLKAAFAAAVQRSFMSALHDGNSAVDHHREVIKLDPNYHDAELTIGFYDYVVGSLPLPIKILASLTGARGSRRRGLETLERVSREGRWAGDDAKTLLIALLKREGRFKDALAKSRELSEKYPRNYLFKLESADSLATMAAVDRASNPAVAVAEQQEAISILQDILRDRSSRAASIRAMDLIHFRYGEALLAGGQAEQASKEFLAAVATPNAEVGLATMSLLRAAQAEDLAGKRSEAVNNYKLVLTRPNIYDAHDAAKDGLKQPYTMRAAHVAQSSGG